MRHQQLNLLVIFDAIMTEGSITRAATRLSMTQPAVSNAVARMREAWGDELFIKEGRNSCPTLFAQNLWAEIRLPLTQLSQAIEPDLFDPFTSQRNFRVSGVDLVIDLSWGTFRQYIEKKAPGISIHAHPYSMQNSVCLLNSAKVDLVYGIAMDTSDMIVSDHLFDVEYVVAYRTDHPLFTDQSITLEQFTQADHLLVSPSGNSEGYIDTILHQHGIERRIAMTVNHFSAVTSIISTSNLITVIPSTAICRDVYNGNLSVAPVPIDFTPNSVFCHWHRRQENDAGHNWIREQLNSTLITAVENHRDKFNALLKKK
ncbi:LysR family transcriptional regulator [Marinibactrum halimedae]|uniref:LysR family transcriptional regulator n=1 Tax=Marinibactrum halimedae TaxID=1444977 RepID=A0AA37T6B4_9GAMM|nr:LysR family transcriptional regulator [Marinibactrum halimedae]MCD9460083.1 LysR family transcriptional regulator [Marinibactrum halimedae]GLS26484.1 LysR family transcriptional regulator [Marinibactrum halimedae]